MSRPTLADLTLAPLAGLERVVFVPLFALKRARGWRRRGLTLLYLVVAAAAGALAWREASIWRLPNAPEPFDLAKYGRVEVADADNAIAAYREVIAKHGELAPRGYNPAGTKAWAVTDWPTADPEVRRWAEEHRAALQAWLPANDRSDALLIQPSELRLSTPIEPVQSLRPYVRLALLEGSRLEQSGDLAGAWRMYRAALRASRHAGRHGGEIQRLIGHVILRQTRPRIDAWIDHPGMTPGLLRRAIDDLEACRSMSSPASEMVRAEYFSARAAVNDPGARWEVSDRGPYSSANWYNQLYGGRRAHRFLRHDPERSARILRLVAAGYLAQCDRPRADRPRLLFPDAMIYAHDARTPEAVRAIAPEALESWFRDSLLGDLRPFGHPNLGYADADSATFDYLALKLAERAFAIERGRPARTFGDLLGGYLKALPEGAEATDLLDPGSE